MHADRLAALFADIGAGQPPPADGWIEVVGRPGGGVDAVLAFTNHAVVAAPVDAAQVHERLAASGVPGVLTPAFLGWLSSELRSEAGSLDVLMMGLGDGTGADGLRREDDLDHHRVNRARRYRPDVEVYVHPAGGVLVLGAGVAGRWELAFEVDPESRNDGLGRNLVAAALALTPLGVPLFAQIAPGNVASMRAAIAGGMVPVGAEVLLPVSEQ